MCRTICAICGDELTPTTPVIGDETDPLQSGTYQLECRHAFHEGCIRGWCMKRRWCLLCLFNGDLAFDAMNFHHYRSPPSIFTRPHWQEGHVPILQGKSGHEAVQQQCMGYADRPLSAGTFSSSDCSWFLVCRVDIFNSNTHSLPISSLTLYDTWLYGSRSFLVLHRL